MTSTRSRLANPPQRVVLGVTGSFSALMAPVLAMALRIVWEAQVRAVLTHSAQTFVTLPAMAVATGQPVVAPGGTGAANGHVEHMELAQWADLVLVAPATANMLGVLAHGLAPDPVSACVLAVTAPVAVAPSMNPHMWVNDRVQRNVSALLGDGFGIVPPMAGTAAVDMSVGLGAMPPPPHLIRWLETWLGDPASAPVVTPPEPTTSEHRRAG